MHSKGVSSELIRVTNDRDGGKDLTNGGHLGRKKISEKRIETKLSS